MSLLMWPDAWLVFSEFDNSVCAHLLLANTKMSVISVCFLGIFCSCIVWILGRFLLKMCGLGVGVPLNTCCSDFSIQGFHVIFLSLSSQLTLAASRCVFSPTMVWTQCLHCVICSGN